MSHVTRHTSHVTRHTSHVTPHTSHVTPHRGDALTAIDGTSILDISGGGVSGEAVPSSGEREGVATVRHLHQDSLRSLIVGPEGYFPPKWCVF